MLPLPKWTWKEGDNYTVATAARAHIAHYVNQSKTLGSIIAGDVWSARLPYVEEYIAAYPSVKFIVVERAREAVVKSFSKHSSNQTNHWVEHVNGTSECVPVVQPTLYQLPRNMQARRSF